MWPADSNPLATMSMWPTVSTATPPVRLPVWPAHPPPASSFVSEHAAGQPPLPSALSSWPTVTSNVPIRPSTSAVWPATTLNELPTLPPLALAPSPAMAPGDTSKSTVVAEFKAKSIITPDLPRRLKYLTHAGLISHTHVQRARVDFILHGASLESEVVIKQHGIEKRGFQLSKTDETRRHSLYGEVYGQPSHGWIVNVAERRCPCDWWFKFGCCVHLVEALTVLGVAMDPTTVQVDETFVSRRRQRRRRKDTGEDNSDMVQPVVATRDGRPATIGIALSLE